ncbi:zinc finger protein 592 [Denticeps clupeoides]|uniref:C2H2-type domain-containing protein n=1 Tax=Denticeps clupeoides TaxID=299321 RepID=A0AAY4C3S6_9TELE|nr:zinc finger protein 592 [Denticeps clupeoides]
MGDMKTPDFDDLLAAFDIPDPTSLGAKESIRGSHDETENHLKHTGMCIDDNVSLPHAACATEVPAVSVIVKNTSRQESFESLVEKELPLHGHLQHNGFKGLGGSLETHHVSNNNFSKLDGIPLNGDCSRSFLDKIPPLYKIERLPISKTEPQFSPISSPESEDMRSNGISDGPKQMGEPYFSTDSFFPPVDIPVSDNQRKTQAYSVIDQCREADNFDETVSFRKTVRDEQSLHLQDLRKAGSLCISDLPTMAPSDNLAEKSNNSAIDASRQPRTSVKTSTSKLSSCLEALEALNAWKNLHEQTNTKAVSTPPKEAVKVSPKVPMSPRSPRSPLEVVKRLIKQPDSPMSICSDSSGKASPAVASGSPLAIPRVRIKTIKTLSGQIRRTATSVLPDSEAEELQSSFEMSPSQSSVEESSSKPLPICPSPDLVSEVVFENGGVFAPKAPSSRTSRTLSSKVKKTGNSRKAARSQNATGVTRRTKQKKGTSTQSVRPTKTRFLPKALHLANLNLVPHSVAASVTAMTSSHRPSQPQLSSSAMCSSVPLVHQVKKATPSSRTAIPTTAAGTLNRLLNDGNPVPMYVPDLNPPAESNISLPAQGYCCLECGDSFGLQKSLAFHYNRKSVHIEVTCTHCSKSMVFFNKCALLAHAREHKNKGVVMQCTQLFMKPIPAEEMFSPPPAECSSPRSSQAAASATSAKSQPVMPLYPDKMIRHGLKCLECNVQMSDYRALAGHYQRQSEETDSLTCKGCGMLLPNKCSYKAHQRVHAHKSPYCCPECGAVSRSVDIQKHVKENCLHYSRKVAYTCIHCDLVYTSSSVLKSHIEEKHCEVFFKCTVCPVAFKSSDGCVLHVKNKHSGSETSPQMVYKCSCETVFKKKQLLLQHFSQRAKKLATCVFKCPECTLFFPQKLLLVQHIKEVHGGVYRAEPARSINPPQTTSDRQDSPSTTLHLAVSNPNNPAAKRETPAPRKTSSSAMSLKSAGWTCGECVLWLPDRESYVTHLKTSHGKSVKIHPCRHCERSFNSTMSLRRHIRNNHDGKKKGYTCWYCTDEKTTFTQHFMLKNHISLMHGIKNPDFSQMSRVAGHETSKREGQKRTAEGDCGAGRESSILEASSEKRVKAQFRCSKCGFTSEDRVEFQEHIPQHKTHSDTPQCQHCGLCFTSQQALNRHLLIVHKVKEPESDKEDDKEKDDVEDCRLQGAQPGEPKSMSRSRSGGFVRPEQGSKEGE